MIHKPYSTSRGDLRFVSIPVACQKLELTAYQVFRKDVGGQSLYLGVVVHQHNLYTQSKRINGVARAGKVWIFYHSFEGFGIGKTMEEATKHLSEQETT